MVRFRRLSPAPPVSNVRFHSWKTHLVGRTLKRRSNGAPNAEAKQSGSRLTQAMTELGVFTKVSQPWRSSFSQVMTAVNSCCSRSVIGPRFPEPI